MFILLKMMLGVLVLSIVLIVSIICESLLFEVMLESGLSFLLGLVEKCSSMLFRL